jgi:hypothetical protein
MLTERSKKMVQSIFEALTLLSLNFSFIDRKPNKVFSSSKDLVRK